MNGASDRAAEEHLDGRAPDDDGRSAIFQLDEHLRRQCDSAKILMLPMPFELPKLACFDIMRSHKLTPACDRAEMWGFKSVERLLPDAYAIPLAGDVGLDSR